MTGVPPGQKEWLPDGAVWCTWVCSNSHGQKGVWVGQPNVCMFSCTSDLGCVVQYVCSMTYCFKYLLRMLGLSNMYHNILQVLHFLQAGQSYVLMQQCPISVLYPLQVGQLCTHSQKHSSSLILFLVWAALCACTIALCQFYTFSGQGRPTCMWVLEHFASFTISLVEEPCLHIPVDAQSSILPYLLDQSQGGAFQCFYKSEPGKYRGFLGTTKFYYSMT